MKGRGGGTVASTYWEAKRFLDGARTGRTWRAIKAMKSTQIEGNPDGSMALRYHATQVVVYHPDNTFTIDHGDVSGSHRGTDITPTVTTRGRINHNSPAKVFSNKGEPQISLRVHTLELPTWVSTLGFTEGYRSGAVPWFGREMRVDSTGNPVPAAVLKSLWPKFRRPGVLGPDQTAWQDPKPSVWPWELPVPGDGPNGSIDVSDLIAIRRRLDGTIAARLFQGHKCVNAEFFPVRDWEEAWNGTFKNAKEAQRATDQALTEHGHSVELLTLRQFTELLERGPTLPSSITYVNEGILKRVGHRKVKRMNLQIPYDLSVNYGMGTAKLARPTWPNAWPGIERDIVLWLELDDKSAVGVRDGEPEYVRIK